MVNHDAPHQLRGRRDKVGPALPDRLRIINQPQVGFVENGGGLQSVAGALPAHVVVSEPVQFRLHQRKQLLQRSLVSAAPLAEQLGDLLPRGWGRRHTGCSTPQILTQSRDFYSTARQRSKKTVQSWRVSGGLSALTHEPAQTTDAPEKPKQKANLKQSSAFDCLQRKARSDETANSFDRHSRLWLAVDATSGYPDCTCTGPKAVQVRPGTSFRSHRSLPAKRGGERCRFSKGGHSRCGYAGFACGGPAA